MYLKAIYIYMKTFNKWFKCKEESITEMQMRTMMKYGYPDGYGVAFYPPAFHMAYAADAVINRKFRQEQIDIPGGPDTALPDSAGDKAQAEYRRKMGVLPKATMPRMVS